MVTTTTSAMSMASTTVASSLPVVPPAMMATTMSSPPLFSLVPRRLLQFVAVSLGMCPTPTLAPMVSSAQNNFYQTIANPKLRPVPS
ncbi:unnamed protein product [Sphagnum balticum]